MSRCPYTWFKSLIGHSPSDNQQATELRVRVIRNLITVVDVSLPARSARWLMELIPGDVLDRIKAEGIPIADIQDDLAQREVLVKSPIFKSSQPHQTIDVWLE